MWKWIGESLQRKLSCIMLVSTLLPLLMLGWFAFQTSSRITEEKTKQSGLDTLRQMQGNLHFILKDVENMSLFLIGQRDVQQFMSNASPMDDVKARTSILGLATNLVSSKEYISDITLYPATAPSLSTSTIYESDLSQQITISTVKDKVWSSLYKVHNYAGMQNTISFIRPLRSNHDYVDLGWLSISLDEKIISRYWSEPKLGDGNGRIALINAQGIVLSATDKSWLARPIDQLCPSLTAMLGREASPQGTAVCGEGHEKQTVLFDREPLVGWTLVGLIPYDTYSRQSTYIWKLTATIVVVSILINVGLILFFVQRITNPLRALTRLLGKINPEEPLPVYAASSTDEIGKLADSYNMLGMHIKRLKEQVIRNEARKKEADMVALQAQINPHFLYNTLSSIRWIALMNEEKRIADMVGALSEFLRFSLNKGKEHCPLHQELAHVKRYMEIQAIRFPDKFDVDYMVDVQLNDAIMLKLLLQPLVENALIHGIQKKPARGKITVCVERRNERIEFLVLDDGVGMSEEQLQLVREHLEPGESEEKLGASYGLLNVHERLRLHYGPEAGLHIESRLYAGTRVSFSIPHMEAHHANHDRR